MPIEPYYQDDYVVIYLGDCLDILPQLNIDKNALFITDPPYVCKKADWDLELPIEQLKYIASFKNRKLIMPGNLSLIKTGKLFDYTDMIILHSLNGITKSKIAFGNYIPVLAIGNWKWEARPNCLDFIVNTKEEKINHPSPKPLNAIKKLFRYYVKDEIIIDPFMGSGTILKVAKLLGLKAIGIEIEKKYCDIAIKRLSQEVLNFG